MMNTPESVLEEALDNFATSGPTSNPGCLGQAISVAIDTLIKKSPAQALSERMQNKVKKALLPSIQRVKNTAGIQFNSLKEKADIAKELLLRFGLQEPETS